jgi:hypothetical protein
MLLRLLLFLLLFLLLGAVMAVEATGGGAKHPMMAGKMTRCTPDRGALQAPLGLGTIGRERKRCESKQNGCDLHGSNPFSSAASR